MFTNYSQTYAANITAFSGTILALLALFGVDITNGDVQFLIGTALNFGGIIWSLVQRFSKGDITPLGVRK